MPLPTGKSNYTRSMFRKMCTIHPTMLLHVLAIGIVFFSKSGNGQFSTNLPSKVIVPENTDTGTTIFTVDGIVLQEDGSFRVVSMFPSDAEKIFQFDTRSNNVVVKNGSLLNFEGLNKAYVIRLEEVFPNGEFRRKRQVQNDLTLLIELQDVRELSDFTSLSSSSDSCCDDVRKIIWLTPVCSVLELLAVVICSFLVVLCFGFNKKGNLTTVEPINPGK